MESCSETTRIGKDLNMVSIKFVWNSLCFERSTLDVSYYDQPSDLSVACTAVHVVMMFQLCSNNLNGIRAERIEVITHAKLNSIIT